MALKQMAASKALQDAALNLINDSLYEAAGGWLALVECEGARALASIYQKESVLSAMWKDVQKTVEADGVKIEVLALNANNAAIVRRHVKWTAPSASGTKGLSVGFSDWLGAADAMVCDLFKNKQMKPILVDYTAEDSQAVKRNFLEAVDTATWGVMAAGYKEGYGANAAGLKTEEEIVKALLYGYSMVGFDCSEKINLGIEKLSDEAVEKRFEDFNDTFRAAVNASYLKVEFKVGDDVLSFKENELHRIILEYGEAIMHVQFIYNSYLKNTPWDIDFELSLAKPGKVLTPQEHYLIANELQRNGIKLSAIAFDAGADNALDENLKLHCEIADTFGYRLSIANASAEVAAQAAKYLKNKVHFKLNNVLWQAAVEVVGAVDADLASKFAAVDNCYKKALADEEVAAAMKALLGAHKAEYAAAVQKLAGAWLKEAKLA